MRAVEFVPSAYRLDTPNARQTSQGAAIYVSPYLADPVRQARRGDDRMWDEADGRHQDVLDHYRRRRAQVEEELLDQVCAVLALAPGRGMVRDSRHLSSPEQILRRYESQRDERTRQERFKEIGAVARELAAQGQPWERWLEEQITAVGAYDGLYMAYQAATTTGVALKTLLQATPGTTAGRVTLFEWWIAFNASAAATPIDVDLSGDTGAITGGTSAAPTSGASPLKMWSDWSAAGVATMQTYTVEPTSRTGAFTFWRNYVPPTSGDGRQYPFGREPQVGMNGPHMFIRVTAGTAANATTGFYMEG